MNRLLILILLLFAGNLHAQNLMWAKQITFNASGKDVIADDAGNVYTIGSFQGTCDFDPGPGTYPLTAAAAMCMYVVKLNANGEFVWAKNFQDLAGNVVRVDNAGNLFIGGYFEGHPDFDPGSGVDEHIASLEDCFVMKMDTAGNFIWAKTFGGGNDDAVRSMAIGPQGQVYCGGIYKLQVDFDPGSGTHIENATGNDGFLLALDSNGGFIWVKTYQNSTVPEVNVDNTGNIINIVDSAGTTFNKYSDQGTIIWTRSITGWAYGYSTVDHENGIYFVGIFEATVDFDPGLGVHNMTVSTPGVLEMFIMKLDDNGDFEWSKQIASNIVTLDIVADVNNNISMASTLKENNVDVDPGPGVYNVSPSDDTDPMILTIDKSGNFKSVALFNVTSYAHIRGICTDNNGNIIVAGQFTDTGDFDPGPMVYEMTAHPVLNDAFIVKLAATLSVEETNTSAAQVQIYPNPATNEILVKQEFYVFTQAVITNQLGQTLSVQNLAAKETRVDISSLPTGVYQMSLAGDKGKEVKRFVKM